MSKIQKYILASPDLAVVIEFQLPKDRAVLSFQFVNGQICFYMMVGEKEVNISRKFLIAWTGEPLPSNAKYIGTLQANEYVLHLVELI